MFAWQDEQVVITLDRLHEKGADLYGEIEVRCSRDLPNALLHHARMNLVSTQTRAQVVRALAARIPESEIDWGAALEMVCHLSLRQWREGEPVIDLRAVPPREGSRFLLAPYVEYGGPTILFAEGGTGKSLFGLAIATAIATGAAVVGARPAQTLPALYLDWESDAETHADRLRAICAGRTPPVQSGAVFYRRQAASLAEAAPYIRKVIAEQRIGFVIVDSMGLARGGEPESADSTLRLFNAARSLGVPWLGIDHVTKNGGTDQTKPFGSIYTVNAARMTWRLEQIERYGNGDTLIAASNHKANNGQIAPRRVYAVTIRQDGEGRPLSVSYVERDARDVPALLPRLSQPEQIREVLAANRGAMTVEDIARCLLAEGVNGDRHVLRTVLSRRKDLFVPLPDPDDGRVTRWGLRADDEARCNVRTS